MNQTFYLLFHNSTPPLPFQTSHFCKSSINPHKPLVLKPLLLPINCWSTRTNPAIPLEQNPQDSKHRALLVQNFFQTQQLLDLIEKIKGGIDPLKLLRDEGDWNKDQFWAVMKLLKETSRMKEAMQVFDYWVNVERSRLDDSNYTKMIELLVDAGLMDEATTMLKEVKDFGVRPTVAVYNFIVHGYANTGNFDKANLFLREMRDLGLVPESETYDGLIRAYGNHRMYDDMAKCAKKMESEGFTPDHLTYNILIREFARGGLMVRMEGAYRTLLSKKMGLQYSTLVAMLEAYAALGCVNEMETVFRRLLKSKIPLKEDLVRKVARAYIKNHRFSRLEDLGLGVASKTGRTDLFWCLLLLSHACLCSRKGIKSVIQEMKSAMVRPNVTFANITALTYLKMKDVQYLDVLLSQLQLLNVNPDIVTVGVVMDAYVSGFDDIKALRMWRKTGFLRRPVEMNTDPLVLTAFGKGYFLRSCEELYLSLGAKGRERKVWTYNDLIDLVFNQNERS
ncbi:hypothetical protein AMTRI_Chr09g33870 [Amborella trichopoda]